jgi:modulator of FtsH protease HflK
VDPPSQVVDAFRDVQRANADRERARNEAESYRNDIIPRARGEAERMVQEAEGVKESQVARARGEAQRFISVLSAYQAAQDVTLRRMYIETMEEILRRNPKILVDSALQGIVPLLNLGDAGRGAAAAPQALRQPQPGGTVTNTMPGSIQGQAPGVSSRPQGMTR